MKTLICPLARFMLAMLLSVSCAEPSDLGPEDDPTYIWRGNLVDSLSGAAITSIAVGVEERPEHINNGWDPHLLVSIDGNGRFAVTYSLRGVHPCSAFPDTTLTLHLAFVDPSNQYETKVHQSDGFAVCRRQLPPVEQLPLNFEDSLRIQLARRS